MRRILGCVNALLVLGAAYSGVTAVEDGLRVYHIGNSHSHQFHWGQQTLAREAGHERHEFSTSNILGAPLWWIWDHDEQCREQPWSEGLAPENSRDAVTLQAYSGNEKEIEYAVRFARLAYEGNPDCRVMMYTIWPGAHHDWQNPPEGRTEAFPEKCARAIEEAFPDAPPVAVIPTSRILRELGEMADRGELPNVANHYAMHSDGGHLSDYGSYVVNVTLCSMLYNEPPFDYPNHVRNHDREFVEIPPETARITKQVVWDVLTTYPRAQMNGVGLTVATRRPGPGIVGRPYEAQLKALNAEGKCRWRLAAGRLPNGLELKPDGVLTGVPRQAGRSAFAVEVTDGQATAERRLELRVNRDTPPVIAETAFPRVPLDRYILRELQARGGVGHLTWDVVEGSLPYGIFLAPHGVILGTPGEAGEFRFTLRVADSHPEGARSDQRQFTWSVDPASEGTYAVKPTGPARGKVEIDGKLQEPFWKLTEPIAKAVRGRPQKKASFGAFWDERALYVAVCVRDGATGQTPEDRVEVFIDGAHNRQMMYNADDTHFVVGRDGKAEFIRTGDPWWFARTAASETSDGYIVEMRVGRAYFQGQGAHVLFGANAVYGFDLAVTEGDGELSGQVWRGTADNDDDTSGFGSIVLVEQAPAD